MKFLAAVFVTYQLVIGIAVPLVAAGGAATMADDCCPGVAPGQTCPMHHSHDRSRTCRMVNACTSPAAFTTLLGLVGIPASADRFVLVPAVARAIAPADSSIRFASLPPDAPPPRNLVF